MGSTQGVSTRHGTYLTATAWPRTAGVDKVGARPLLRDVFSSVDFYIGLVGAPIVYGLLWRSLADISLAGLSVIALQNGFTSHAILDQFVSNKPAQTAVGTNPLV
jgi:hypothetical protein